MGFAGLLAALAGAALRHGDIDYNHLRYSVVRIQAIADDFDWMHPFFTGGGGVGLGTGWVAENSPEPVFVTNAHVVSNAHMVHLQLLVHSSKKWEAEVVSICSTFDLALLVLKDKEGFLAELAAKDMALQPLSFSGEPTSMGEPVVALGFPLGQDSLKISAGVVAGNEVVSGNVCIQSTAPISPGSSGGPLLTEDGTEVVGVNFAKSADASAENINYVIPVWRVKSLLATYKARLAESHGAVQRREVRVPSANAVTVMANGALRKMSDCTEGLFISSLGPTSFLLQSDPPVPEKSFLTKVRGVSIDQFGMGLSKSFCEDRVRYTDLFFMQDDLEGTVEVEVCHAGKTSTHQVPLAWKPQYEVGIRYVDEPAFETALTEFEIFGDVSVMQLTVNHIEQFYKYNMELAGFLRPELSAQSWLIVNYVEPGSYASEFLKPGTVVRKLNGHEVHTLEDFRAHFVPDDFAQVARAQKSDVSAAAATTPAVQQSAETQAGKDVSTADAATAPAVQNSTETQAPTGVPASALEKEGTQAEAAASVDEASAESVEEKSTESSAKVVRKVAEESNSTSEGSSDDEDSDDADADADDADDSESDDSDDEDDVGEDESPSFLAKRVTTSRKNATTPRSDVVWTLETDDGEMYAVFFDEALRSQVMRAEAAQSTSLLSSAVLNAARYRNVLKPDQTFVHSMLEQHSRQRLRDSSVVDVVFAEIPVVSHKSWRPTIERGIPQPII